MTKLLKKDERTDGVTLDFSNLTIINKNRFLILFSHLGFYTLSFNCSCKRMISSRY